MPPVENCGYIAEYLFEAGPTLGDRPIEWPHLEAWQRCVGIELNEFEARAIILLSREYLHMMREARDPNYPPPCRAEKSTAEKAATTGRLREALNANR